MASSPSPTNEPPVSHEEIPPALRKRLEQLFQFGLDKIKTGDRAYANTMFSQCVVKDPSNLKYVEALFDNLNALFEGRKKKAKVRENRAPFKKALAEQEWKTVLKLGPTLLKDNPWDAATLRGMAEACAALHFNEVELRYLKNALEGNPKDVDINRHCAISLARMGQYDQAIACWHRIEEKVKSEALRNISDLTMAKSRPSTGLAEEELAKATSSSQRLAAAAADAKAKQAAAVADKKAKRKTPAEATDAPPATVEELESRIVLRPEDVENYVLLADLHDREGRYREAEQVLRRALPVSGGDLAVRERLEKAQLRRSKAFLAQAERHAKLDPGEESERQLERQRRQHNRLELDVYGARAQRYPEDLALQYEVGVRLKRMGNYAEAVAYFEKAHADARCRAPALLAEGECLQQIRQYKAALGAYQKAADSADLEEHAETRKLALYRAGVLATGLKDYERATSCLQKLLEIDADYRDAAARLDKLP